MGADARDRPRLYGTSLTRKQIEILAALRILPGRFGELGEIFQRKLEYIDFAERKGVKVAIGTVPRTYRVQRGRERDLIHDEAIAGLLRDMPS